MSERQNEGHVGRGVLRLMRARWAMSHMVPVGIVAVGIAGVLWSAGCTAERPAAPSAYLEWINDPDNGLIQTDSAAGTTYALRYLPTAFLVARDCTGTGLSRADSAAFRARYEGCLYFVLTIRETPKRTAHGGSSPPGTAGERQAGDDVRAWFAMHGGRSTVAPIAAWNEEVGADDGERRVMVVFPRTEALEAAGTGELVVVYAADTAGHGAVRFRFRAADIVRQPTI